MGGKVRPWTLVISCVLLVCFLVACQSGEPIVTVHAATKDADFTVELARTALERQEGLMHRESMPRDAGMLFVFPDEKERGFWMKNTLIPLDIIYIGADKKIVSITREAPPCEEEPCQILPSLEPAKYVLEINGGLSDVYGFNVGDSVDMPHVSAN